ncbi:MAG: ATP-binding cassette domain-containing protein [Desulfovibrionaceae bacterium]|nr:ATP-binding cassette domain-containing protein [Desulfovibrionaceae bacterium]
MAELLTAIEYRHIRKEYDGTPIIPDFSLKIAQGEFVTIIGSSGCGKTTLLKMVNGLVPPTSGAMLICVIHRHRFNFPIPFPYGKRSSTTPSVGQSV